MWWIHRRNGWPRRLACYTSRSMRCGTGLSHPWRYCRGLSDHVVGCFPSCADAAAVKPAGRWLEERFVKMQALSGDRIHERHSEHRVSVTRGGGVPSMVPSLARIVLIPTPREMPVNGKGKLGNGPESVRALKPGAVTGRHGVNPPPSFPLPRCPREAGDRPNGNAGEAGWREGCDLKLRRQPKERLRRRDTIQNLHS